MKIWTWFARVGARLPVAIDRRWPIVRVLKRWLLQRLRENEVELDGHRLAVDPTDSLRLTMGEYHEAAIVRYLRGVLRPGDRVIDGGAFIGYHSLHAARAVGESGVVHAFEPDPDNHALLVHNATANGYTNIVAVNAALWGTNGRARLFLRDDHHADHRLYDPGDGRPHVEVETVSLDDYLGTEQPPIRLVKLDLQGSELHALRGMRQTLHKNPDVIVILELWPRGLKGCGSDPRELVGFLDGLGFGFQRFASTSGELEAVDPITLLNRLDPPTKLGKMRASLRSRDHEDVVCKRDDIKCQMGATG